MTPFNRLSDELVVDIFTKAEYLVPISSVCRRWRNIAKSPQIWRYVTLLTVDIYSDCTQLSFNDDVDDRLRFDCDYELEEFLNKWGVRWTNLKSVVINCDNSAPNDAVNVMHVFLARSTAIRLRSYSIQFLGVTVAQTFMLLMGRHSDTLQTLEIQQPKQMLRFLDAYFVNNLVPALRSLHLPSLAESDSVQKMLHTREGLESLAITEISDIRRLYVALMEKNSPFVKSVRRLTVHNIENRSTIMPSIGPFATFMSGSAALYENYADPKVRSAFGDWFENTLAVNLFPDIAEIEFSSLEEVDITVDSCSSFHQQSSTVLLLISLIAHSPRLSKIRLSLQTTGGQLCANRHWAPLIYACLRHCKAYGKCDREMIIETTCTDLPQCHAILEAQCHNFSLDQSPPTSTFEAEGPGAREFSLTHHDVDRESGERISGSFTLTVSNQFA